MSLQIIWPEIKALQTESKHEITLNDEKIAERVTENGGLIDENLFEYGKQLNYLTLSKIKLMEISPRIANLNQLTRLAISDNLISIIPLELLNLTKLVYLDLSQNQITVVPSIFINMPKLRTIILRNNKITKIDSFGGLINLQELFLDYNNIKTLPSDTFELAELMTLSLSNNYIEEIPEKVSLLRNLKSLNMEDNKLNDVFFGLGQLPKLKIIQLKNNPFKNVKTQLKKLINDNLYKAILDNLKKNESSGKAKRNRVNNNVSETEKEEEVVVERGKCVSIVEENPKNKIVVMNRQSLTKSQAVFFIVRNIRFCADKLKLFIKFQEQLHKNDCENRKLLTIGAHDLSTVKFPLKYHSRLADSFKIHMMNLNSAYTGRELYERLLKCADAERKTKKRACPTGVHQYLYLTDIDKPQGVVEDAEGMIVSFPPLTNCNATKITIETTDLLIELIGSKLDKCKLVAEKMISWMIENELTNEEGESLSVEPVRVYEDSDSAEQMAEGGEKFLVVFPSRSDLTNVTVIRD